jgi:hypothetical protein
MEKIKELQSLCKCSVSVIINQHKDYYDSVVEYFKDNDDDETEADVMQKMIETDTVVWVQAYPNTPVGFYSVYHYDLDAALDAVLSAVKNQMANKVTINNESFVDIKPPFIIQ